jgi:hypothetical protein
MKSRRTENGIIIQEHDDGTSKQYVAVRGGLSWPIMEENLPAYYCIIGEELIPAAQRRENQRGKLILLSEYEARDILSLSTFFTKLTDDAKLLECNTFYTITEEFQGKDYSADTEAFRKFMYERQITAHLEEAPWVGRPDLGIYYINEWKKKGLLEFTEGSHARDQLRMVVAEKVNQLPQMFNAANALRFVICGFEKNKPNPTPNDWRAKAPKGTWRSV